MNDTPSRSRPARRRIGAALAAVLALGLFALASRPARADDAQIYLSWHAPWGQPGATDTLTAGCDTSRVDTLWLAFDYGKASPSFLGVNGTLVFHPPLGDTLDGWWKREWGKSTPQQIRVMFPPRPDIHYAQPFHSGGMGGTMWDSLKAESRLRFIYAIPYRSAVSISRATYWIARVILEHPPASDPACGKPVCIEWTEAEITFDVGLDRTFVRNGTHRFVSLNSPGGAVAVPYREVNRLKGWQPPKQ